MSEARLYLPQIKRRNYALFMRLNVETFNLNHIERTLCLEALVTSGTIVDAAQLLGITRHALKRRILKHKIEWPQRQVASTSPAVTAEVKVEAAASPIG